MSQCACGAGCTDGVCTAQELDERLPPLRVITGDLIDPHGRGMWRVFGFASDFFEGAPNVTIAVFEGTAYDCARWMAQFN